MSTPASQAGRVADLGERGLIERIRQRLPPQPEHLVAGIGDDAAVMAPERGALQVLTTDALVEGVHFDRRFSPMADVGYKALAVNVSDVAAMGGTPGFALLSLMLPDGAAVTDVDALLEGLLAMAAESGTTLAGGNLTQSPGPLVIDVSLTGWVRPRKLLLRSGGRPGDELYVSGKIGAGAAGLAWLQEHGVDGGQVPDDPALAECVTRYRRPEPRLRLGTQLGRGRAASACMDLSDGLADAVRQVAEASGTGAVIRAADLPLHHGARHWFADRGSDAIGAALAGGDDYELLFAIAKRRRGRLRQVARHVRGLALTKIGELTADHAVVLERDGRTEPLPAGFAHF